MREQNGPPFRRKGRHWEARGEREALQGLRSGRTRRRSSLGYLFENVQRDVE